MKPWSATACAAASLNLLRISSSHTMMCEVPENLAMSSAQSLSEMADASARFHSPAAMRALPTSMWKTM